MTAVIGTEHSKYFLIDPVIEKEAVAAEIRVEQSVKTQRSMPVLLTGNALGVGILVYLDWAAVLSSNAIYFLGAEVALLLPVAQSYLKLRNLPRPQKVSTRRIRAIEIHSFLMGLVWAIAVILIAPDLSSPDGAVLIMILLFLSYGAAALMPSTPLASAGYLVPLMGAACIAVFVTDIFGADIAIMIAVIGSATMARTIWQNWQDVQATVRLGLEKLQLEADSRQQLATKEAQLRLAMDNMPGGIRLVDKDRRYVIFNARYGDLYDFPEGLFKVGDSIHVENLYQAKRGDFGPGDPEALTDDWVSAQPLEPEPQSWERTTASGKILQVFTAPTPDGGRVNVVTDITERKRAEDELRMRNRELDHINKISSLVNQSLNLDEILNMMAQRLTEIFPVRLAAIGLAAPELNKVKVVAFYSEYDEVQTMLGMELPLLGGGIFESKSPIALSDADTNPETKSLHPTLKSLKLKSMLFSPLRSRQHLIGTIGLPANDPEYEFSKDQLNLLQTIASQVVSAIENAQLYKKTESALISAERDLEIGRQIQNGFLPTKMPYHPYWELESLYLPARQVAGDFYDAFPVGEKGNIVFVIGDVCDKGVGAALFMVVFRSLVRSFSIARGSESDLPKYLLSIVETVNGYIAKTHDKSNMFATLFIGLIDSGTNNLYYANAGHDIPLIIEKTGRVKARLAPTGPAMGIMPDADFVIKEILFDPGDILMCYTDGVVDSRSKNGDSFTEERLLSVLDRPFISALSLLTQVEIEISAHIGKSDQYDDIAMLVLRRKSNELELGHQVSVNADLEILPVLRKFIEKACIEMELGDDIAFAFKLSLDELITNICMHGYQDKRSGPVNLHIKKTADKVILSIEDEGVQYDTCLIPEVDIGLDVEDREIGGMGLLMVQEMMDDVQYERINDRTNRLTISKYI